MSIRMSVQIAQVIVALNATPNGSYGYQLIKETGLQPGSMYPILRRLKDNGLAVGVREEANPQQWRAARVHIQLTDEGRALVARAQAKIDNVFTVS